MKRPLSDPAALSLTSMNAKKGIGLINRVGVKRAALRATTSRAHEFTRVSDEFLDAVEASLLRCIQQRVQAHPSKGKTLH